MMSDKGFRGAIPLKIIRTKRLLIRPVRAGDAAAMHAAMRASFVSLKEWMPWAQTLASIRDTEAYLVQGEKMWSMPPRDGVEQPLQIMDLTDKLYYGATGIKPANLRVPSFETGYWVNVRYGNRGFITEAMNALVRYMLVVLNAKRVEINCEEDNIKSAKVAQRLNFEFEGKLKNQRLDATGKKVTSALVFSCTDVAQLPPLECEWE